MSPGWDHEFEFHAKPQPGWDGVARCKVIEIEPPRRLAHTWRGGPIDTVVTFTVEPVPEGTRLRLEHTGIRGVKAVLVSLVMGSGWKSKILRVSLPAVLARWNGSGPCRKCRATRAPRFPGGSMADVKKITGMSDEAVKAKTGKAWREWFSLLDRAGARKMAHRDIACLLYEKHKVPGWWAQMVTVGYERARGRRKMHETPGGFSVSRSKTIAAPVSKLFRAWQDPKLRNRWLKEKITVRKATRNKTLRITWGDQTHVNVLFWPKGNRKTLVVVQHEKLKGSRDVSQRKSYWAGRLDRLAAAAS